MAINAGVIVLSTRKHPPGHFFYPWRLDIEDNIGEGIHIHYKNLRLDYSVKEMVNFAEACEKALLSLGLTLQKNEES